MIDKERASREEHRRPVYHQRRVESPTKRAVEEPVSGNKSISAIPRIPIPAGADPTRSVITVAHVDARRIDVSFRQVRRSQAAPAIQIALFIRVLVEFFRFQTAFSSEINLVASVDGYVMVSVEHRRFAAEHSDLVLRSVKIVQTGFLEL